MNFDDLDAIDWDTFSTTTEWTKLLNDLLGLAQAGGTPAQQGQLADRLDEFADHSSSDDLDVITRLDRVARKAARALRSSEIAARIRELQGASADFLAVAKEFSAASVALKKEASLLRAEKFNAAVSSLTGTISSLKALTQAVTADDDDKLGAAISQAVASAQRLRGLLEKPA